MPLPVSCLQVRCRSRSAVCRLDATPVRVERAAVLDVLVHGADLCEAGAAVAASVSLLSRVYSQVVPVNRCAQDPEVYRKWQTRIALLVID